MQCHTALYAGPWGRCWKRRSDSDATRVQWHVVSCIQIVRSWRHHDNSSSELHMHPTIISFHALTRHGVLRSTWRLGARRWRRAK
eukprot:2199801-Rhodomonas_salina.4